jgi:hypothetical protein
VRLGPDREGSIDRVGSVRDVERIDELGDRAQAPHVRSEPLEEASRRGDGDVVHRERRW